MRVKGSSIRKSQTFMPLPLTMTKPLQQPKGSTQQSRIKCILQDAGKVSAEIAKLHAETEFEKYRVIQDRLFMSDYDRYLLELEEKAKK